MNSTKYCNDFYPLPGKKEKKKAGEVYSKTLTDGYARLTPIAYRTTRQCPNTRLILLGAGASRAFSFFMASEIGAGKSIVKDNQVAFAATISDPTRGESQPLFQEQLGKPPLAHGVGKAGSNRGVQLSNRK